MISTIKKLLSTNIFVQFIGLLIYPILIAIFSIKDFALYGLLYASMTISSVILTFKIENIIFSLKTEEAYSTYIFYMKYLYVPLLSLLGLGFLLDHYLFNNLGRHLILALISGAFLAGFNVVYNNLVRSNNESYNFIKIVRALLELLFIVVAIYFQFSVEDLFLLVSSSYLVVIIFPFILAQKESGSFIYIKRNIYFLKIDLITSFLNNVYLYSPNYFLYFGGSKELSGYYFLINRVFGVPVLMVAQSLSTTLKQYLAGKDNKTYQKTLDYFDNNIFSRVFKYYLLLCVFSLIPAALMDYLKYPNFLILAVILMPLFIFRFKFVVYSGLFYILRAYKYNFKLQLYLVLTSAIAILVGWLSNSSLVSIAIYAFVTIFIYEHFYMKIRKKEVIYYESI